MKEHISVCICTYHRNVLLEKLLRKLALQDTGGIFEFSVIVVDNDAKGFARETVTRLRNEVSLNVIYDIEPENTIPAARNHALRLSKGDYIGIIDDDEFPPQEWLITLYRGIQVFDVDGALGPVIPFYEKQPPEWLIKSALCERPVHRTGTLLRSDQTRTGNVLMKKHVFAEHGLVFDLQCRTSGSDKKFFREAMDKGYRFIAVKEAPVYEVVPPERWKKRYYVRRALVHGFNSYKDRVKKRKEFSLMIRLILKSMFAFVFCVGFFPVTVCRGSHVVMQNLEKGAYHLSTLCAVLGIELIKKRDF